MTLARLVELARRGLADEAQERQTLSDLLMPRAPKMRKTLTMTEVIASKRYRAEQRELDNLAAAAATEE